MSGHFDDPSVYDPALAECPLCRRCDIAPLYVIERYSRHFKLDRCNDCGFIFMNPRFTPRTLSDLYGEEYYRGSAEYSYYDERSAERFSRYVWDARMRIIRKYASGGNLLDIGAAFGGLMKASEPYFTAYGIEPSPYAAAHARELFGPRLHEGTLDDNHFPDRYFSCITMIEVLEHIADPVKALRECFRLLKAGGLLVVQTANMDGLQARRLGERYAYLMPGHLSYFTRKNLTDSLLRAGFVHVKAFHPVEFGLRAKLLKSRMDFTSPLDYRRWLRIASYHYLSKIRYKNFAMTSSMVLYAFK